MLQNKIFTQGSFRPAGVQALSGHATGVEYSPGTNARPCICDVEQRDQQDYIVGGERFIYDPDHEESFGGGGNERSQIKEKKTNHLHIYPVPTEDVLYVEFESAPEDIESNLSVFDSRGVLQIQKNIATQHPNNILRLDVKQLGTVEKCMLKGIMLHFDKKCTV